MKAHHKVVLIVLDGWGIAPKSKYNAISIANTPHFNAIRKEFGQVELCASGACVGLTEGQMGNSEVGHLTIGAGRIIFQDLMRVYDEINSGRLEKNSKLLTALREAKTKNATVHFLGLVSDGGVHSHIDHLFALLKIAKGGGIKNLAVHAILDGRDTPPRSGVGYIASLQNYLDRLHEGALQSVSGRFYSMDRDNRWERTKLAFDAIVYGKGEKFQDAIEAVKKSYSNGVSDEFVVPHVRDGYAGISNGDLVVFFNFRPDRARQLTRALSYSAEQFGNLFDRDEERRPKDIKIVTMTIYDSKFRKVVALLGQEHVANTLSNVLERNRIRQLRIAETEKYAHVTYFFNGLVEKPRRLEDRKLVPSLKIGTYDKKPEMSARNIADEAVRALESGKYGFILINFANADMVGHSGNVHATVKAVETVDECLGRIFNTWKHLSDDLSLIITADHGNAEKMYDNKTGQPHTAHTSNPVPLILVSKVWKLDDVDRRKLGLKDVSPTVLKMIGLARPPDMSGRPFVRPAA
ncbi:MAG: 2,3-bisphosphoglycerate-independent phosphoglycerate mutase [Nitrososphaerota archaeon]|nr:2,3-bisphosphoglycerate-independent phosphoglycerate mutase [Nitrososphaerota archaeon]